MPESSCLHIQDHESAPIRVVDIPWISVRIGRAAFCEVRLTSDDLADEACRLYRRGRSWHLVPGGGKSTGKILLEGRPVTASRPLPYDVPFRIGRFCLTLRQDRAVNPDWGMYPGAMPERPGWFTPAFEDRPSDRGQAVRADLVVEPQTIVEAPFKPEWRPQGTPKPPVHGAEYPAAASVKDRWETRWRVAGAELKARAQRSASTCEPKRPPLQAGFDSVPLKEPPASRAQPTARPHVEPPPRSHVESPVRPHVEPPPRSHVEPPVRSHVEPPRSHVEPPVQPHVKPPVRPHVEPPRSHVEPPVQPHDKPPVRPHVEPPAQPHIEPPARPIQPAPEAKVEPSWNVPAAEPSEPRSLSPRLDEWIASDQPVEALWSDEQRADTEDRRRDDAPAYPPEVEPSPLVSAVDEQSPQADDDSWYEMPVLAPPPATAACDPRLETPDQPARSSRKRPGKESLSTDSDRQRPASSRGRKSAEGKRAASSRAQIDSEPRRVAAKPPEPDPAVKPAQWPSAKDILASHRPRLKSQATRMPGGVPTPEAGLTDPREPAHWTLPGWIAGPPAAAFVVAVALVGGTLSWRWATDAYSVSIMTGRLFTADGRAQRDALPDSVAPPDGTWTRSTAQHLAHWAIFMSRNEPGQPPSSRDVAALLDRALQISPLNPTARLAVAQLEPREIGVPLSQRAVGLSRDAISLSWCARRLLATGDKEGALKIFEKALKVAALNEASRVLAPNFSDDPNVPRYLLPGEERVQDIVREIVAKNEWTFREWSAALPRNPATFLAAARLLKKQGRSEADTLLDLVLDDHRLFEGAKTTSALVRAARAEAFALKSRLRESEEQYRLAIDLIDDDTIKRSWWFNLADIELRLDDESQRQTALRAALADASDDISRRATEIQRATGGRPLTRSSGPKAN